MEHQGWAHFEPSRDEASAILPCQPTLNCWACDNLNLQSTMERMRKHARLELDKFRLRTEVRSCANTNKSTLGYLTSKNFHENCTLSSCVSQRKSCHERVKMFSRFSSSSQLPPIRLPNLLHPAGHVREHMRRIFGESGEQSTARKLQETKSTIDW